MDFEEIHNKVYCELPGSVHNVRTESVLTGQSAMMIFTWHMRSVHAFRAFHAFHAVDVSHRQEDQVACEVTQLPKIQEERFSCKTIKEFLDIP